MRCHDHSQQMHNLLHGVLQAIRHCCSCGQLLSAAALRIAQPTLLLERQACKELIKAVTGSLLLNARARQRS